MSDFFDPNEVVPSTDDYINARINLDDDVTKALRTVFDYLESGMSEPSYGRPDDPTSTYKTVRGWLGEELDARGGWSA